MSKIIAGWWHNRVDVWMETVTLFGNGVSQPEREGKKFGIYFYFCDSKTETFVELKGAAGSSSKEGR